MATPKTALSGSSKTPRILSEDQHAAFQNKVRRRVSQRAYDIYRESGGQDGNDYQHWIQAENEVLQHGLDVRESGSWLALNGSIPDDSADNIEIWLTPTSVVVHAEKSEPINDAATQAHGAMQREIFLRHDLNADIEPSTASATLKDQKLTIMVKKRYPVSAATIAAVSPATSSVAQSLSKKESAKA
jgi:HSP20 family molecular chaperone IbpA